MRRKGKRTPDPEQNVREQFRVGASRVYGAAVWRALIRKARHLNLSNRALAERAGYDASAPSKGLKSGELSFPQLVVSMVALEILPRSLPDLPTRQALARGGYVLALPYVRYKILKRRPLLTITSEDVDCLRLSYRAEYQTSVGAARAALANQIVAGAGEQARLRAQEYGGPHGYIVHLRSNWSDAWNECLAIVRGMAGWVKGVDL